MDWASHSKTKLQPGNAERTYADTQRLEAVVGYKPATEIEQGIARFVKWYRQWRGMTRVLCISD